jgi:lipopolysaccharide assembly protein A
MKTKAIVIVILSLIVAVVSIQNAALVELKFFVWTITVSRILLILISFTIGMVVGFLLSIQKKAKPAEEKKHVEEKKNSERTSWE